MAAPKGNSYYLLAKSFVKPKSYSPKALWKKAIEYFLWNDKNPLIEEKVFGSGKRMTLKKVRAMTITGFCNFVHINRDTFNNYEKLEAYSDICKRIKDIIYQQKLEGAAADLLNPSIIAREIGLADKQEITGKDGQPLSGLPDLSKLTDEELAIMSAIQRKIDGVSK
jgi:hypothetical protein